MSDLNDPRVFFAAERTLLAWNRTSLTLMGFGFVIERFGLFIRLLSLQHLDVVDRGTSYWMGIAFILMGVAAAVSAIIQYRRVLKTLRPVEIPEGYSTQFGVLINAIVAVLGLLFVVTLFNKSGV